MGANARTFRIAVAGISALLFLASCARLDDGGEAGADGSMAKEAGTTTSAERATTIQSEDSEMGEVLVSETLDPMGSVLGGASGPSYFNDAYPTELTGMVDLAIDDLADNLAVDVSIITVVLVEEVAWGDASLGCPQPGMSYAQVVTDGLRIVLEADGLLHDYRSGGLSDPVLCVQAVDQDKTKAGIFQLTEDGEIIYTPPTTDESSEPSEGINPPDE
jgi:hypothetical protein